MSARVYRSLSLVQWGSHQSFESVRYEAGQAVHARTYRPTQASITRLARLAEKWRRRMLHDMAVYGYLSSGNVKPGQAIYKVTADVDHVVERSVQPAG